MFLKGHKRGLAEPPAEVPLFSTSLQENLLRETLAPVRTRTLQQLTEDCRCQIHGHMLCGSIFEDINWLLKGVRALQDLLKQRCVRRCSGYHTRRICIVKFNR